MALATLAGGSDPITTAVTFRFPSGLRPGQKRFAKAALAITALVGCSRSVRANARPAIRGIPLTFGSVSFLLLAIALVASYLPARRAAALDPLEALRYE